MWHDNDGNHSFYLRAVVVWPRSRLRWENKHLQLRVQGPKIVCEAYEFWRGAGEEVEPNKDSRVPSIYPATAKSEAKAA